MRNRALPIVLGISLWLVAAAAQATCNKHGVKALATVTPKRAMEMVAFVCTFPPRMDKELKLLRQAGPMQRPAVLAQAVVAGFPWFVAVCGSGAARIFARLASMAPEKRAEFLVDSCGLDKTGVATKAELTRGPSTRFLPLAFTIYGYLRAQKSPHAKRLTRALLGLR